MQVRPELLIGWPAHVSSKAVPSWCSPVALSEEQFNVELVVRSVRVSTSTQTHHTTFLLLGAAAKLYPVSHVCVWCEVWGGGRGLCTVCCGMCGEGMGVLGGVGGREGLVYCVLWDVWRRDGCAVGCVEKGWVCWEVWDVWRRDVCAGMCVVFVEGCVLCGVECRGGVCAVWE